MGFQRNTSIRMMPGATVSVSTTTVTYVGRATVVGEASASSAGRSAARRSSGGHHQGYLASAPGAPAPAPKPGLLAPREEKALYAYAVSRQTGTLDPLVLQHPVYGQVGAALLGVQQLHSGNDEGCVRQLQGVIHGPAPIESNPFVLKYLSGLTFDLDIAGGVLVRLPLTNAALTLALAEALQSLQRGAEAIQYVEQLQPTYPALLSLAELYVERRDWEEVLRLTDELPVDSDVTALLAILRSQAHQELGHRVAARECLATLTADRNLSRNVRFKALVLRSNISVEEKAYGDALADLEKVLAENSQIPGIRDAIDRINQFKRDAEQPAEETAAAQSAGKASDVAGLEVPVRAVEQQAGPTPLSVREAGFYPDPEGVAPFRYWDGGSWTSRVRMTQY